MTTIAAQPWLFLKHSWYEEYGQIATAYDTSVIITNVVIPERFELTDAHMLFGKFNLQAAPVRGRMLANTHDMRT